MRPFENYRKICAQIEQAAEACGRDPKSITLVAVTKGRSVSEILELYALGVRDFGENRLPEVVEKMNHLPSDIRWHFIGKVQKNKVQKVAGAFFLIHSVDTWELAEKLSRVSVEKGTVTPILLQVNTSGEMSKSGLTPQKWEEGMPNILSLPGIKIQGAMTLAPLTENQEVILKTFAALRVFAQKFELPVLSMGMTNDFALAIREGATLLRIGTGLFR